MTPSLKVLIADDEAPARNKMVRMLQEFENVEIVNISNNGLDAFQYISLLKPDIVFLDVEMPGMNGLEVAQSLPDDCKPHVVFATAYNEHAIRAFELNAVDYLLKPFSAERLKQTLEKVERLGGAPAVPAAPKPAYETVGEALELPTFTKIPVLSADRYKLIDFEEVVCIEYEDRITQVYTHSKSYPVNITIDAFEKKMPASLFYRVSRSTIINIHAVQEIVLWFGNRYKIILNTNKEVICSRERSKALKNILKF